MEKNASTDTIKHLNNFHPNFIIFSHVIPCLLHFQQKEIKLDVSISKHDCYKLQSYKEAKI